MDNKKIIIDFSNGESEELTLNENLSDDLLEEALRRMDLQEMDDIYGDVYEDNKRNKNENEKSI